MLKQLEAVKEWHLKFGVPVYEEPTPLPQERAKLRHDIMKEEVDEFYAAALNKDIIGMADGLADMLYVLIGTAHECGLSNLLPDIFDEVCRSNMSKLGEDGKPIYREDGKILKGPNFFPPDIKKFL